MTMWADDDFRGNYFRDDDYELDWFDQVLRRPSRPPRPAPAAPDEFPVVEDVSDIV
jgi:hypothetical protein